MANPAQACQCLPHQNLCCCGTLNGISVAQPLCQTLPDGSVVNNPAYVASLNRSYWTYKFITDCAQATRGISGIGIPICAEINPGNITVEEQVDGCGPFSPAAFELIKTDPNFGTAPNGTVFLKIESSGRYDKGVCVVYRIGIIGNYPEAAQPISVKAATAVYKFGCSGCYVVPGCVPDGRLLVSKSCLVSIVSNQAALQYSVHVDNVGEGALSQVFYEDTIVLPPQLSAGAVTVSPPLDVDASVPGRIVISGQLGAIEAGGRVTVTYSIPITGISAPGAYSIANLARAYASGTESTAACVAGLEAVRLRAVKCCQTDGSTGSFVFTLGGVGNSPDVVVDVYDRLRIPAGVTLRFPSFVGCEAYYAGTSTPVPAGADLAGPLDLDVICRNVLVPLGGSFMKTLSYTLVSSSAVGAAAVTNAVTAVTPLNLGSIVYQGTDGLPASAAIDVRLSQDCATPCL